MTFTPDLERGARAIAGAEYDNNSTAFRAEERARYINRCWEEYMPHARACFESALPVSEVVVEAMAPISDPVHWKDERWRKNIRERTRETLTAAIRAIVGREGE